MFKTALQSVVMVQMAINLPMAVSAGSTAFTKEEFMVRKVPQQVVLYTIYRGSYDKVGESIGKLFATAGQKGLIPCGPVSLAYLNNPRLVAPEHYLTEVRIPVKDEALKAAGTFGVFTDVKKLPATEAVVATKPAGMKDPATLYQRLSIWIFAHRYAQIDSSWETVLTQAAGGDYAQMKSEIIVPVVKLTGTENGTAASRQEKKK